MPLPQETLDQLTALYGNIEANFTITQTPQGEAPEFIKEQWIGISLPVRASKLGAEALKPNLYLDSLALSLVKNDEPISVEGIEAVAALRDADRIEAVAFWQPYSLAEFVFRACEGDLVSVRAK